MDWCDDRGGGGTGGGRAWWWNKRWSTLPEKKVALICGSSRQRCKFGQNVSYWTDGGREVITRLPVTRCSPKHRLGHLAKQFGKDTGLQIFRTIEVSDTWPRAHAALPEVGDTTQGVQKPTLKMLPSKNSTPNIEPEVIRAIQSNGFSIDDVRCAR